jgi:ATP-binding cassette, subfamily B, bacterial MsbA
LLDGASDASLRKGKSDLESGEFMPGVYRRLLRFLRPYWRRVILAVVAIMMSAALSGLSLTLVVPFLNTLFGTGGQELVTDVDPASVSEPGTAAMSEAGSEPVTDLQPAPDSGPTHGSGEPGSMESLLAKKDALEGKVSTWLGRGAAGERLRRILVIILLAFFFKNLFGYLDIYLVHYLEQRCLFDIRQRIFAHLQTMPLAFFARNKTGVIISRVVNDVNTLRGAIIGATAMAMRNGLLIIVLLGIIFATNWRLALATMLIVPPNAWLMRRLSKLLQRDSTMIQQLMGDMADTIQETSTGVRVVKAFGREEDETGHFRGNNWLYFKRNVRLRAIGALNAPLSELLGTLSVVIIVGYGGMQVLQGQMDASLLVLFVTAVLSVSGPLRKIAGLNQLFQEGIASGRRVFEVLDQPGEAAALEQGEKPGILTSSIRYENVSFAYPDGDNVLTDIDLELPAGKVVALVGPSGSGKSTLADLLPRFHETSGGRITMDGQDIGDFALRDWRLKMGIVTQDVILFNDTIYNNIAYGRPDADRTAVEKAAVAARAHDFIVAARDGYDTVVGERGLQLSGGERQRLAIARAILRDPEILIFDEATSALDTESERLVQEAIEKLMAGRTTLVIAHRLSTIRGADKIVVVQRGRIVEQGRHQELMDLGGLYRQLHDLQFEMSGATSGP